ncbi:MAG: sigma-70 family RNA polymerase sigma factor [Acidobacteria bacterium]|nr:sigma-70 family RNA polymerase sigma factor [Acidobacteriota bacterium]MBU4253938.1 sigma-70 family RNA polymerase sigma factor [Acidobacteriota bacterium]MBU4494560.1 sigma-70 family RNA polymerase sigma factor [Acidobacteriota bacterium]MCG2815312.1 sigma-70 family RNA polymerase sigma factor [Candidatus Aminicenantes bacterium]
MKSLTDNDIMEQVRDGRIERTAILFERHHVRMFNFFLRLTGSAAISEDLVQEVFLRILKYRSTYQGQSKFSVWLYQIARNAHIDNLRKQKSTFPIDDQFEETKTEDRSPGEFYEQKQDAALVQEALRRLPLKKRGDDNALDIIIPDTSVEVLSPTEIPTPVVSTRVVLERTERVLARALARYQGSGANVISFDKSIYAKVNGGGPVYQFKNYNGDIMIRKAK